MKKTTKKTAAKKSTKKAIKKAVEKSSDVKKKSPVTKTTTKSGAKPVSSVLQEKRLSAEEIGGYKNKLLLLRARLRGDVSTMTDAALSKNRMESSGDLSAMPIHMADVGTDNFEQEQTLSFMQSESGLLDMVEEALQRIKDGTYGICESCECRIPKARLSFLPYAAMCVKCAEIAQTMDN